MTTLHRKELLAERVGRAPLTGRHYFDADGALVLLEPDEWDDMGQPTEITITIEPGDRLNEESDDAVPQ